MGHCQATYILTKLTGLSLTCPLSVFTTYCPYGIQLRLDLIETLASTCFAFFEYLTQANSFLWPIAKLSPCVLALTANFWIKTHFSYFLPLLWT